MDILIKNMEMPKACSWYDEDGKYHECRLFGYGGVCQLTKTLVVSSVEKRHDDCPLVALPEHGTLKDVDEISQMIISKKCRTDKERLNHIYDCILNAKVVLEANNE